MGLPSRDGAPIQLAQLPNGREHSDCVPIIGLVIGFSCATGHQRLQLEKYNELMLLLLLVCLCTLWWWREVRLS